MRKIGYILTVLLFMGSINSQSVATNKQENKQDKEPWDMVLIYSGSSKRPAGWFGGKYLDPYIALEKDDGTFDWLFDGFLFLEIRNEEKSFFGSHGTIPANKEDWETYANKFFMPGLNITALNDRLETYKAKGGGNIPFSKT